MAKCSFCGRPPERTAWKVVGSAARFCGWQCANLVARARKEAGKRGIVFMVPILKEDRHHK